MLQQTQVDRVLPKYARVAARSIRRSTRSPRRRSAKSTDTWYPLGYNIRPRRLQTIAREAVARYGGQLPADEATLLSFKGIGAYTAGAIRSFAFRERAAILDTNVARVLFRVFVGKGDPKSHAMKRHLWTLSETLVPRAPRLRLQPGADGLRRDGLRGAQPEVPGLPDDEGLPRLSRSRAGAADDRRIVVAAAVIERDGRFLVTRRQAGVHLEGYWEFPGGKCEPGETLDACLARELREELDVDGARRRRSCSRPRMRIRSGASSCTSSAASSRGEPRAAARPGDAVGRARRAAALEFPPARTRS